jgi:hypothetical protein
MDVLRLVADGLPNREKRRTRSATRADLVALAAAVLAREGSG